MAAVGPRTRASTSASSPPPLEATVGGARPATASGAAWGSSASMTLTVTGTLWSRRRPKAASTGPRKTQAGAQASGDTAGGPWPHPPSNVRTPSPARAAATPTVQGRAATAVSTSTNCCCKAPSSRRAVGGGGPTTGPGPIRGACGTPVPAPAPAPAPPPASAHRVSTVAASRSWLLLGTPSPLPPAWVPAGHPGSPTSCNAAWRVSRARHSAVRAGTHAMWRRRSSPRRANADASTLDTGGSQPVPVYPAGRDGGGGGPMGAAGVWGWDGDGHTNHKWSWTKGACVEGRCDQCTLARWHASMLAH